MTVPDDGDDGTDGDEHGQARDEPVSAMDIVATVSHELRSPLTSIKGYTALLLNRWDILDDERKQLMLAQVAQDADRVTRLLNELLDISRLETGRLSLRRAMVDLAALAVEVVGKVNLAVPELEATVSFPTGFPEVYVDADKVTQVLTNLVENAVKYADPAGVRISGEVADGEVAVAVSDRGEGIAVEDLPHVFDRFFHRDEGRPSGTGLGLWISRGLVEAHGGRLTAESQTGRGSTFRFTFPTGEFERIHGEA